MSRDETGHETFDGPGLGLRVSLVPWDSRALGFPAAQIDSIELRSHEDSSPSVERLGVWLDERDVGFVSCRLDSLRLRESMLLEELGFRFVEMVYSPVLTLLGPDRAVDDELVIESARDADRAVLEEIASSAFTTGRHVLDWRLGATAGHVRYRNWLDGALVDDRQQVLKAAIGEAIVGFFIVESRPDDSIYWHLTAVANEWQGRGVGKRVWRGMIARHQAAGARRIETTISAHNTAVLNLYAGLGFRFTAPRATFHWLRR